MKRRIAAPIGALLLMLAIHAPAQVGACKANAAPQCRDSQVISASGNSIEVWGNALFDSSTLNTGTATTYIVVTLQNSVSADSCYVSSGSVVLWPKG